jgi:hypothetical protein
MELSTARRSSHIASLWHGNKYKIILILAILIIGVLILLLKPSDNKTFPASIVKQVDFSIFYPEVSEHSSVSAKLSTVEYSQSNHDLTYTAFVDRKQIAVSEQDTPDVFSESGVYDFKLSQAHQYDNLDTNAGLVYLTRPTETDGQTVAWDNTHGTLILAHGLADLSPNEWQQLFNNLTIIN